MLKKLLAAAVIAIVSVFGIAFIIGYREAPKPVPKEQVIALVTCMVTDSCEQPRVDLMVNGKPAWAISTTYDQGTLVYMVSGDLKLRIRATTKKGSVMVVDSGTGVVEAFVQQLPGQPPLEFRVGDHWYQANLAHVQEIYFEAMQEAAKRIIPKPGPTT